MAAGDWPAGTTIRVRNLTIGFDENQNVQQVGIGYDIVLASRRGIVPHGHSWIPQDPAVKGTLDAIAQHVCDYIMAYEGLPPTPAPPDPRIIVQP